MTDAEIAAERIYCLTLLASRGNHNIPADAVPTYMECQAVNADKARHHQWLARAYRFAAKCVSEGDWTSAWQAIKYNTN